MTSQIRLQLSDTHIPFHDPALMDVWLDMLKELQPDGVDIIGDLIDCYPLSRFEKNPKRRKNLQHEIDAAVGFLKDMVNIGGKLDYRYCEGNHEKRLTSMLWSSAKDLGTLRNLTIPKLMGLEKLGITYYGPRNPYKIGDLYFIHGDVTRKQNFSKSPGGRAACDVAKAVSGSVLMGHTHQMGYGAFRSWEKIIDGYEIGCMCQFDLDYIVGVPPWCQGWSVVTFHKNGLFEVTFIRVIEKGKKRYVLYEGEVIAVLPPSKVHHIDRTE